MLAFFGIAYGSLAFAAASIWSLPADVAPTPHHVASISGIQNFASNLAGIVITTFTGVMVALTKGSFTIPLIVAGGFCFLGAFSYLVIVGRIEPLPTKPANTTSLRRRTRQSESSVRATIFDREAQPNRWLRHACGASTGGGRYSVALRASRQSQAIERLVCPRTCASVKIAGFAHASRGKLAAHAAFFSFAHPSPECTACPPCPIPPCVAVIGGGPAGLMAAEASSPWRRAG